MAGFADAETNPRQRESRRRNRKGWSVNSVIVTRVRRDDGGGRSIQESGIRPRAGTGALFIYPAAGDDAPVYRGGGGGLAV